MAESQIFLGPPGVGKTTLKKIFPGRFIDPENSINWVLMDLLYNRYHGDMEPGEKKVLLEQELDWPVVWVEEILPRIRAGLILEKDIIMNMVTPSNAELVSRFLEVFRKRTSLIMPDEEKHYFQVWNDHQKRPRTWGSEVRGWQNTFWTRLLLQGLASELGIKRVDGIESPKESTFRMKGLAVREAIHKDGREYVEVFFGRWAEIDGEGEIVAMHKEAGSDRKAIVLECDKTSKACGRGQHDCQTVRTLTHDINGISLAKWIAQDKLKSPAEGKKNAAIFFVGTIAPFHHGHQDALDGAKAFLESKGWNVIGGYVSTFEKLDPGRVGPLSPILADVQNRNIMLQLGTMESDWLMADFPIKHVLHQSLLAEAKHPSQLIVKRLRNCGAIGEDEQVTTFWVNGKDAYFKPDFYNYFTAYADKDRLNPLRILVADNREGDDAWTTDQLDASAPGFSAYVERFKCQNANPSSGTAIREALMSGNRMALRKAVGFPLVEAFLLGKMHGFMGLNR